MRKLALACIAIALFAEPVVALPAIHTPAAPAVSGNPVVNAAYGHWRRVTRRTVRRHYW